MFPNHQDIFSIANIGVVAIAGMSSVYLGGIISDRGEKYFLPIKGFVAGIGALLCFPFIFFAFTICENFWPSITLYFIGCLFGEAYVGPNISMIQSLFDGKYFMC